jgi:histidyl-tRNA synthetase
MAEARSANPSHSFQAPKGTRDLYPQDLLRRRYIEKMWRDTAIRHGFEEIDGPTFEHLDLYTVKSGEGIVSELFSFRREGGEKDYALRPEFTPTLARMYAAKAGSLPKPTKWFWQQNCFRAERPQRGRLREFGQWNVDLIGGEANQEFRSHTDADVLAVCVGLFESLGLQPSDLQIEFSHRGLISGLLLSIGISEGQVTNWLVWLDRWEKLDESQRLAAAATFGATATEVWRVEQLRQGFDPRVVAAAKKESLAQGKPYIVESAAAAATALHESLASIHAEIELLEQSLVDRGLEKWCKRNSRIVRGLAYYTGMVFEVHEAGGKERAIAGGGRYDNLIEMFGGPPTPAVGFGMGDVVLSLILQDRGLMPEGQALLDKLSEPPASLRPDIFVISNGQPESDAALRPLVAQLRRGGSASSSTATAEGTDGTGVPPVQPHARPLHARHTYKTTKNIGKLLQEAGSLHARFAAIIENASEATVKNLTTGEQHKIGLAEIGRMVSGA